MNKLRAIYLLNPESHGMIYGPDEQREIAELADVYAPPQTRNVVQENPGLLSRAEIVLSGWGGPLLDETFLDAAPKLQAVFYGAGSMSSLITPAVWERRIVLSSALKANAVPVAEYALAAILFSLKHGWRLSRLTKANRFHPDRNAVPGCYGSTVGIISLGAIARKLLELLRPFDLSVLVYDPFLSETDAAALGIEQVSLDDLFRRSHVVSLHAPSFPETQGMITGEHIDSMKPGATFINTARGELVRESEMIDVLSRRPDLHAVLDVTLEEPPAADSLLYALENVTLTPHMAGSVGTECRRMGRWMVEELRRFVAGQPLKYALTQETIMRTSHRPTASTVRTPVRKTAFV